MKTRVHAVSESPLPVRVAPTEIRAPDKSRSDGGRQDGQVSWLPGRCAPPPSQPLRISGVFGGELSGYSCELSCRIKRHSLGAPKCGEPSEAGRYSIVVMVRKCGALPQPLGAQDQKQEERHAEKGGDNTQFELIGGRDQPHQHIGKAEQCAACQG